jgi:hypothetical protein
LEDGASDSWTGNGKYSEAFLYNIVSSEGTADTGTSYTNGAGGCWASCIATFEGATNYYTHSFTQMCGGKDSLSGRSCARSRTLTTQKVGCKDSNQNYVRGYTVNSSNNTLGNCTVLVFNATTNILVGSGTSNANGRYEIAVPASEKGQTIYVVCFLAGSPDVMGVSDDNIVV